MKPYATRKGGSRHVKSDKFGDHIVADHVIMKKSIETGVDDESVMMVIKDIYTQYRYAYPAESKSSDEIIKGFNHFLRTTDSVGVVYTDNSPEFNAAIEEYGFVHQNSVEYVDSTKAVVEREARTILEGARTNLVQSNMDVIMWPYAVRHHCMALNLSEQLSGEHSSWELRYKREFDGKIIPFGCLVHFWENRKRPDSVAGKMSPNSSKGVFIGYHIQSGHVWRDEYLVAHLDGLDYKLSDGSVKVIRTKRLELPDGPFVFPLSKDQQISVMDVDCDYDPSSDEGGPDDDDQPGDDDQGRGDPTKESQPPDVPVSERPTSVEVEPPTEKGSDDSLLEMFDDIGEGHEPSSSSSKPPEKDKKSKDYSWFDLFYDETVDPFKMPDGSPVPKGYVYDGSRLVRHRKNSRRVPGYPSDLWGRLSQKERNMRWEYQKRLKDKEESKGTCAQELNHERFAVPSMPVEYGVYEPHRSNMRSLVEDKLKEVQDKLDFDLFATVARVLTKTEIAKSPGASKALDIEWNKLLNKKTWDQNKVKECRSIVEEARRKGEKVHIGRIFEICTLKGSELPEGDPNRKYKGRTCFQGNNVFDESSDYAIFAEMSSSPASMEAAKILDAYGCQPRHSKEQADARQAYTQAVFTGIPTWLRLPRNRWPKDWQRLYKDPLVPLLLALYGHPDSGGIWEKHFEDKIATKGWVSVLKEVWKSMFFHPEYNLLLVVYVDDLKMAGPTENMKKGWQSISSVIDIDEPEPYGRYFGCEHEELNNVKLKPSDHPFAHVFSETSSVAMASQHRTNDFWEHNMEDDTWIRHHIYPRKKLFHPRDCEDSVPIQVFESSRTTIFDDSSDPMKDEWKNKGEEDLKRWWTGKTIFKTKCVDNPEAMHAAAAKAKPGTHRKKSAAKRLAREQRFTNMENLNVKKGKCMEKPVNIVRYNMKSFLESCVEAYCQLAKVDKSTLKRAPTPFHDNKVARPKEDDEKSGRLQPIASKVLMKILFAARMARYDLLRATQSLASRVTKWSEECDVGLHRLVSYIQSTLDLTMQSFIGDQFRDCQLWLFADADFAGEHDSKSTTGSFMALVGPNTYFPINAFSKKQTAITMSSTEAEVIAANHSVRTQGLPSLSLFNYILALTDPNAPKQVKAKSAGLAAKPKVPKQNEPVTIARIDPEMDELRYGYFHNGPESVANLNHLQLHTGPTFNVKFLEDNQATITILTNGSSSQMRHTDRTQRVSFGWLKQQFESEQFDLINVNTNYQAADILTKPFTSPAKWDNAVRLLGMQFVKSKTSMPASRGDGNTEDNKRNDRLLVEFCCSENSKLGEDRKSAKGCEVIRVTIKDDATKEETIAKLAKKIRSFHGNTAKDQGGNKVMIFASLPCTGGCPWNRINKDNPGGLEKIQSHQKEFKLLFKNLCLLVDDVEEVQPTIAMELPTNTEYWKWDRVKKFLKKNNMIKYSFHGCSLGLKNRRGEYLKKGWTIASNETKFKSFEYYQCPGNHHHAQSRGKDLKEAESYTYRMTDKIHDIFRESSLRSSVVATPPNTLIEPLSNPESTSQIHLCAVAMSSSSASQRPDLIFSEDEKRRLNGLAAEKFDAQYSQFWREEIIFAAYNLMRMQSAREAEVDESIEGILAQCRSQVVLETWNNKFWENDLFRKITEISDDGLGYLRDGETDLPLERGRPKKVWLIVSDSGLILLSGSKRNRQYYEPTAEFLEAKPVDVDDLVVRPMWGKKLFHLTHELDRLVAESKDKFGQDVEIHATIYWSGNELVGPDGIEDEPRWPFRPSRLDQASVYEGMKERLKQLDVVAKKCSTFALVAGPEADIYGFTQVWDMFFERFRTWCKDLNLKYVDATCVAEHIDKADHYHGRKTVANVSKITSFFVALLQAQQIGKRFEKFAPAFDAILARKLILSYDDFIEMEDNTAQSQKQRLAYQKVKQRVLQEHAKKKLGRSKTFTREQVDDLAPIDEELTEADKAAIVEIGAHVSMMEVDAPRKRQADAHTETSPTKHRVMKPELTDASSSLGSSAKHAPAEPKISTAVKSTQPLPPSTTEPSSGSGLKRPPPPPKGVSVAAPPVRTQAADVKLEYFDMAITGLPGHYLNVPADPKKRQEVRVSVPGSMVVTPLIPMLGSELVKLPGVQRNKVPSDRKAVRAVTGLLRGFMSDGLNRKTDYQGFAHLDDVKRELLTGKFSKIVAQWDVLTFMSIGAFDDKDRFEFLCAVDLSLSIIDSQTVPFKMRCVQGHQKKFLENRDPCIGASRVFCLEERKELFAARLTEYGNNGMPPRMYHRTSATAALEILPHGLIPGGVGVTESGKKHCYLSPCQLSETGYKSGVRADQPYEVAFDTELALRSAVDLTMTSSEALITTQHIPNSCILWVKNTRDGTFIFSLTEEDKRKIYRQAEYAGVLASDTFGPAAATGSSPRDEIPAETHRREEASDVKTVVTQIKHIEERVRGDDEANEPVSVEERQSAIEQPTQMFGALSAVSKGTIPSGTYVALPESACPNCIGPMIDGMFTCMNCGYIVFSSKRRERCLKFYRQRAELLSKVSRDANVRISADSLLDYWQGADLDSRISATWESEQLRKGRQRLNRAMKLGFFNVVHRYQLDNTFASSLANVNRDLSDCVLWDTYSVLRLAGVERSAGQRTLGTGPMERINKNERAHVAKICFITVPYRLLHEEFKDRHGSEWMVFWHQKLFTLTDFVRAVGQAHFDDVMVLTFSQENQGLIEFHLRGLDEYERYNHLKARFDEDLDIAARQHYMAENNSRRSRKQDATLERIETEREDVNFPIPPEASIDYRGYQPRPTQSSRIRLIPKQPPGPPPARLLPPPEPDVPPAAAPAYPPDVRDRPARVEAAPVSSRPTFQLRTNGYWYWSRNLEDWVWYQTGNRNEQNPYSPDFIPSDDTLNYWMGQGWIDWTCRFGYRSY